LLPTARHLSLWLFRGGCRLYRSFRQIAFFLALLIVSIRFISAFRAAFLASTSFFQS
jgi:hypothetical protein